MGQVFYASPADFFTWSNGAIGYRPGGPPDCLGPYAKVRNCPIDGTDIRLTCYATAYPDTFFQSLHALVTRASMCAVISRYRMKESYSASWIRINTYYRLENDSPTR